jgi:hypothetical protein
MRWGKWQNLQTSQFSTACLLLRVIWHRWKLALQCLEFAHRTITLRTRISGGLEGVLWSIGILGCCRQKMAFGAWKRCQVWFLSCCICSGMILFFSGRKSVRQLFRAKQRFECSCCNAFLCRCGHWRQDWTFECVSRHVYVSKRRANTCTSKSKNIFFLSFYFSPNRMSLLCALIERGQICSMEAKCIRRL